MNALLHASVGDLWSLAGWTMVHFLWLGAIVAALATIARIALRSASPSIRYAVAIGSLFVLAALPFATAAWLVNYSPPLKGGAGGGIARSITQSAAELPPTPDPTNELIELHAAETPTAPGSAEGGLTNAVQPPAANALPIANPRQSQGLPAVATVLPPRGSPSTLDARLSILVFYLPWLWLIGTPLTFALLVSGVVGTRRLGRSSHAIDSDPIVELLAHLAASLRITRRVTVAVCDRIASPVLIGIIRPMILLPPAALTGWSPDEIEMVLLHELAHVRRWDNLVNLLQRCVESLLFFHPAVWLISSWARREREACCDATVVARTNRPHAYAELLVALAAQLPRSVLFHPAASSAMSAGPLRSRIRQILKLEEDPMLVSGKSLTIAFASLLVAATLAVLYLPKIGQADQSATEVTENAEKSTIPGNAQGSPKLLNTPMVVSAPNSAEVSEQAWKQLGIRIHLASPAEQTSRFGHALKVDSGIAIPKNLAGPVFLLGINQVETNNFDDLAAALQKAKGEHGTVVKCVVHSKEGRTWINTKLDGSEKPEQVISKVPILAPPLATSKFPSLEEQKLADLAYKRLGVELENISDVDLKRVKALGYDGGVSVTAGAARIPGGGSFAVTIQPGDILVGLGVWPTTNMKAVGEILTRPEIAELNPVKFYVVRDVSVSNGPPEPHDVALSGRVEVQLAALADPFTGSGPAAGTPEPSPYHSDEPRANPNPFPVPPNAGQPSANDGPYTASEGAPPSGAQLQATDAEKQRVANEHSLLPTSPDEFLALPNIPDDGQDEISTRKKVQPILADAPLLVWFFYTEHSPARLTDFKDQIPRLMHAIGPDLKVAITKVDDNIPIASAYHVTRVPTYLILRRGEEVNRITGVQTVEQLLAALTRAKTVHNAQQNNSFPPQSTASPPTAVTPVASPEELEILRDRVKTIEDQLTFATERLKAGKGATEFDVKRVAIDLATAESDVALAEGHREVAIKKLQDALHEAEMMVELRKSSARAGIGSPDVEDIMKATRNVSDIKLKLIRLQYEAPHQKANNDWSQPLVKSETGQPSVPTSNRKTSGDSPLPADLASTPEQILTAPKVGEIDTAPKHDASLLTPTQPHPYDIAAKQTTPKDTPTAGAHPNPSIGAHHDDYSSDSRSSRSTRPDTSRPRPPSQSVANSNETPSDDRILVAYNIPAELVKDVNNMRNASHMYGEFGSGGRYFLQATPERQKQFQQLLDATPKWRDAEKVKSRAKQVCVKTEKDGQEYVEWQPTGLTFTSRANPKFATPAIGGGGWASNGVIVAEVAPGSPGDWSGIEPGDVMTKAGHFETKSLAELESLLETQGQDYSTKIVQCFIICVRAGSIGSFNAQFNLAIADTQSKPSAPIGDAAGLQAQTTNARKTSTPSLAASTEKPTLRYDGKTFAEWRELWKTELSTDKRTEAIKALAAFGRNGNGKEAAETILDVASNYDFDSRDMDKALCEAIINALGSEVPANDWRPLLRSRYDKDPGKWADLAASVLPAVHDADKASSTQNRDFLAQIARLTNQPTASNAAFDCLVQRYSDTPETSQLLQERVKDKTQLANVVSGYAHSSAYPPEIVEMLMHGDPQQQTTIRLIIERFTNSPANKKLTTALIQILEDAAKPADHLAAIRGLAVTGRFAQKPAPETVEALKKAANRDSTEQRIAAGFALESVTRGTIQAVPFLEGKVQDANGNKLDGVAIQSLLKTEKEAVFGEAH